MLVSTPRTPILFVTLFACLAACGDDGSTPEADAGPDATQNTAPMVMEGGEWTIMEDTTTTIPVLVSDPETDIYALEVTASSSDEARLPSEGIVVTPNPGYWLITLTPAADANGGPVTLTFTVSDGEDSASATFDVTILAVNDRPSFTPGAHVTFDCNEIDDEVGVAQSIAWATNISPGPADESGQSVGFVISNNNPGLFSVQPALSADGTLTFTLAESGTAGLDIYLQDDGGYPDRSPTYRLAIGTPVPAGGYLVNMHDSFGDGWSGSGITISLDGGPVFDTVYLSSGSNGSDTVTIPEGTGTADWYYTGDAFLSEVSFEIYLPNGALAYASPAGSAAGPLDLDLCATPPE